MSSEKQPINILIPTVGSGRRWLKEIENVNNDNPGDKIIGIVRHPYSMNMLIPENSDSTKLTERKLKCRIVKQEEDLDEPKNEISFDAVIPRISGERTFEYGCNLVRHLTLMGVYSTAPAWALETCSNKWKTSQLLATHGLPVPDQLLLNSVDNFSETMQLVKGVPAVGKLSRGSQGSGVFILNDLLAAKTALQSMAKLRAEITLNRFVRTSEKENTVEDLRVWVLDGSSKKPQFFAMKRITSNDFRANISLEGTGEKVELSDTEKQICQEAAKVFGMDVVAVDLIRDVEQKNKPLILELNGNPGLKIEKFTGENIVRAVIDMVVQKVKDRREQLSSDRFFQYAYPSSFASGNRTDILRLLDNMRASLSKPNGFSNSNILFHRKYLTALQHLFNHQEIINTLSKKYETN